MSVVRDDHRRSWDERGFFVLEGFADDATCAAMLARAVEQARRAYDSTAALLELSRR